MKCLSNITPLSRETDPSAQRNTTVRSSPSPSAALLTTQDTIPTAKDVRPTETSNARDLVKNANLETESALYPRTFQQWP